MAAKLEDRIQTLSERLEQLKARQVRIEARKRQLAARKVRRDDTRRKILVGAVVLARVEQGRLSDGELRTWLDQALTRADDRALVGLI